MSRKNQGLLWSICSLLLISCSGGGTPSGDRSQDKPTPAISSIPQPSEADSASQGTPSTISSSSAQSPATDSASVLSLDSEHVRIDDASKSIWMIVEPETIDVPLADIMLVSEGATWKLYRDGTEITSKTATAEGGSLVDGDNLFSIVVTSADGSAQNEYALTIYRSFYVTITYLKEGRVVAKETAPTGYEWTLIDYSIGITGYSVHWLYQGKEVTQLAPYEDIVVTAVVSANTYTITLDPNGGTVSETIIYVDYDSHYELPTPVNGDLYFLGWYDGMTKVDDAGTWTSATSMVLVAKWVSPTHVEELLTYLPDDEGWSVGIQYGSSLPFEFSITIPETVDGKPVLSIRNEAFYGCSSLVSVVIPSSVTSIGEYAFYGCSSLASIEIPSSVTSIGWFAFSYCPSLASIEVDPANPIYDSREGCNAIIRTANKDLYVGCATTLIPSSVWGIANYAFYGCSSLTSIEIPSRVGGVAARAFFGCSSLASIEVDPANHTYDSRGGCNAIIETSSNRLVVGCAATLIPDSVTKIGEYAFYGCSSLASVEIPSSVTWISEYAFSYCSSLASVEIPSSVISIYGYAFYGCSSLASLAISSSVAFIGQCAFSYCSSLASIEVDPANPNYDSREGCNAIIETSSNRLFAGCAATLIPSSVDSIGEYAFSGCSSLISLAIPSTVIMIGSYAFFGCSSLASVEIPSSVISIHGYTFSGCSSLTSVEIPSSVISIDRCAFFGCSSLTSVVIPSSVKSFDGSTFDGCYSLTSIFYSGNADQWASSAEYLDLPSDITVYFYSVNEPTELGNWWHYVDGVPTIW